MTSRLSCAQPILAACHPQSLIKKLLSSNALGLGPDRKQSSE